MPRPTPSVPTYRHHKASNRAYTVVGGKFVYLGRYDSPQSREKYARIVRESVTAGPAAAVQLVNPAAGPVTVAQVLAGFLKHAETAYAPRVDALGRKLLNETHNYHLALRPVAKLYAGVPAVEFGPKALKAVRDEFVSAGMSLNVVNRHVHRIRRVFRWAVEEELVPGEVAHRLTAVASLRAGHAGVTVRPKVKPVDQADIDAVLPLVPRRVADMVRLQLLTGMRPGNVVAMRVGDLDMSDPALWVYTPRRHKTQHRGHELTIAIGPRAQDVIRPYLKVDREAFIFSPAEGEAERRAALSEQRVTPLNEGNKPGKRVAQPRKAPGPCYTTSSYGRAVYQAIRTANEKAGCVTITPWHPHQLRHNRATQVRAVHGTEAVLASLGVKSHRVANIYAEVDASKAAEVARSIG